jgi:hypothetical protein
LRVFRWTCLKFLGRLNERKKDDQHFIRGYCSGTREEKQGKVFLSKQRKPLHGGTHASLSHLSSAIQSACSATLFHTAELHHQPFCAFRQVWKWTCDQLWLIEAHDHRQTITKEEFAKWCWHPCPRSPARHSASRRLASDSRYRDSLSSFPQLQVFFSKFSAVAVQCTCRLLTVSTIRPAARRSVISLHISLSLSLSLSLI